MAQGYWFINEMPKLSWVKMKFGWNKSILDVGCADGLLWEGFPYRGTLLDKEVREGAEPCHPDVVGTAEDLPFADNSFDIVLLSEILEHLEKPEIALREATRVAKLKVILTVPWEAVWRPEYKPFTNPEHIHYFDPLMLQTLISGLELPFEMQFFNFHGMIWIGAEIYCGKG